MKKLFVGLFVLALSVAGILGADLSPRSSAEGEQKFSSLPIGANLEGYIHSIEIWIGPYDPTGPNGWNDAFRILIDPKVGGSATINARFPYSRARDGKLTEFATLKIREMVGKIPAVLNNERFLWRWSMHAITEGIGGLLPTYDGKSAPAAVAIADPDSSFALVFRNGTWEVPEEVFGKVKFQFGWGIAFYIPEMSGGDLEVNLYGAGGRVSRFSTLDGVYDVDNPCKAAAILADLPGGWVIIPTEIAIPRNPWWNRVEIILLPSDERKVVFEHYYPPLPFDGRAVRWSDPSPKFFDLPPLRLDMVRAVDGLEFYFSGSGAGNALLEESGNPEGPWELSYARIAPAASTSVSAAGRKILIPFSSLNGNRFFQLRAAENPEPLLPNSR